MSAPPAILSEIQKLAPSAIMEMFVLDASNLGAGIMRFHAGTNDLKTNLIWQGEEYVRFPIQATGFEYSGSGQLPRPKLQVSNFLSSITALLLEYEDLLGAKIIRKRTLKKFLDEANFVGGNPTADPESEFPDEIFYIDRKISENRNGVEFELAASFDLQGVQLPRRQVIQNVCAWRYRGGECGYTGDAKFDEQDQPTDDPTKDKCGKRLSSCKCRFGEKNPLNFGGFPGADLYK